MTDPSKNGPVQPEGSAGTTNPWGMLGASWTASMEALSAWSQTWQSLAQERGGPSADRMMGALHDPARWPQSMVPLLDEVRRALALPRFADLPPLDGTLLPSPESALDLVLLQQQYLTAVMPVWAKACETFQAEIESRRARGETIDVFADGLDVWNGVLDRTLMEFNRSADYAGLQQRMLRLAMRQRKDQRRRVEVAAEAMDMPTRTEMLDVYGRLHVLMREVHTLRREVRALRARAAAPAGPDAADAPS